MASNWHRLTAVFNISTANISNRSSKSPIDYKNRLQGTAQLIYEQTRTAALAQQQVHQAQALAQHRYDTAPSQSPAQTHRHRHRFDTETAPCTAQEDESTQVRILCWCTPVGMMWRQRFVLIPFYREHAREKTSEDCAGARRWG
jgi:hypothetical protein